MVVMIAELNANLLSADIPISGSESCDNADVNLVSNYVKEHLHSWDPIHKGSDKVDFTRKYKSILNNKVVLGQKEIDKFKKLVDGKNDGIWMQSLLSAYTEVNYMDLQPELSKYGVNSIQELLANLTPLVFHIFHPSDDVTNDCLIFASNLEQPVWMYKNWVTREYALQIICKDLLQKLSILSCKYFQVWVGTDCIESYKCDKIELSKEFIVFLLYYYDIVNVEVFRNIHCIFFKTSIQDSWNQVFKKARMKNIVDFKYKFDHVGMESKIVLYRSYHKHRLDLSNFLPSLGKNRDFVSVTKVVSPTTLAVLLEKNAPQLNELHAKLTQFYKSKLEIFSMKDEDIQPFTECVVVYYGSYRRAMIASIKSDTHVVIELTDVNWMTTMAKSELMYLHSMFTKLPFQGFTLKLGHITGLIADRETVITWLKHKLKLGTDMTAVKPEVCKVDATKRIVTVLLKVKNESGSLVYLHNLMSKERLVTVNDASCIYHTTGLC